MDKIIIERTGLPPLVFSGEVLSFSSSKTHNATRWSVVTLYRTEAKGYVARMVHNTQWANETSKVSACRRDTAEEIVEWLRMDDDTMSTTAHEALMKARDEDPNFYRAYTEHVD